MVVSSVAATHEKIHLHAHGKRSSDSGSSPFPQLGPKPSGKTGSGRLVTLQGRMDCSFGGLPLEGKIGTLSFACLKALVHMEEAPTVCAFWSNTQGCRKPLNGELAIAGGKGPGENKCLSSGPQRVPILHWKPSQPMVTWMWRGGTERGEGIGRLQEGGKARLHWPVGSMFLTWPLKPH